MNEISRARDIMGSNYFGPKDAIKHFKVSPTEKQLSVFSEIPFPEEILEELNNDYVLVADFGLSVLKVRTLHGGLFYGQSWYDGGQPFAAERGELRWQLVRKREVPESLNKNLQEQLEILPETEEVPVARLVVYTAISHFLNTGERLFESVYVRTSCMDSRGFRVHIGYFDVCGLDVSYCWDDYRRDHLGVASARKVKP